MSEELIELKSELERLQRRIEQLETPEEEPVGRRNMLRGLGAAATGAAVGGLAFARPASATDGQSVLIGDTRTSQSPTAIHVDGSYGASPLVGAFHVTNDITKTNLQLAVSCITAVANSSATGGLNTALMAQGSDYGAKLDAPIPLKLLDSANSGPPPSGGYTGQFRVDNGDLWFCVDGTGSGAEWRRLTGTGDAGMFNPVTPFRVYESRTLINTDNDGPINAGDERTISVANSIDVNDGSVLQVDAVPAGATGITFNITIVGPSGGGFLAVAPSTATAVSASTINWDPASPAQLANASFTQLGGDRQIKVLSGGVGSVDFLIDVTGFYL